MNPSRARILAPLTLATLTLAACSGGGAAGGSEAQGATAAAGGEADVVQVATAFYPLAWVTQQVGGEHVDVQDLTPPGSNEHDLELSPATVDAMSRGDLVVYLQGFQPAVDDAVETIGDAVASYDVSADAELQPAVGDHNHAHDHDHNHAHEHDHEGASAEEHADHAHDHDHEGASAEEHAGHDHAGLAGMDPHFWLDPNRLASVGQGVAERLAQVDPDNAEDYRANAQVTAQELTGLADQISSGLAQCENSSIVVTHEAYGYLTEPHGIEMIGISGIDPDTEPSPARIAEIERAAIESDATTVFGEVAVDQKIADVIAEQTGLAVSVLDPLGSQVDEDATYPGQMQNNLDNLRTALECA